MYDIASFPFWSMGMRLDMTIAANSTYSELSAVEFSIGAEDYEILPKATNLFESFHLLSINAKCSSLIGQALATL